MILLTGCAGFIGFHLAKKLLEEGYQVFGIDNLCNYYDVNLKKTRLDILSKNKKFIFYKKDISNEKFYADESFEKIDFIIHLAAQAGVRYSIENPKAYFDSNMKGFFNILEFMRKREIKKMIYASSSSVYGNNNKIPFSEEENVDTPESFYAATKKSNELMAESYSKIFNMDLSGLRFFTVYGPFGRPDMAYFSFVNNILNNEKIKIFNNGNLERDFTYIDDIVESIYRLYLKRIDEEKKRHEIYNIGNGSPVNLLEFIEIIEKELGETAQKDYLPMQTGDVFKTWANTDKLFNEINYRPQVHLEEGIKNFVAWYRNFYELP